ncbi:MAG: T9SS type A sorting domain-containing protein [Bacteroidota bacterium]
MRYIVILLLTVVSYSFARAQTSPSTIVAAEYFVDDYVDFGQGAPLSIIADDTVSISATLTLSLSPGVHRLYVRVKDSDGVWSQTYSRLFLQPDYDSPSIVGFEYFVDDYVDFGKGTFVTMEADSSVYPIAMPDDLDPGVHVLYTRAKSTINQWSHTTRRLFLVPDSTGTDNIVRLEYYYTDSLGNNPTDRYTYSDFDPAPSIVLRDEGLVADDLIPGETYLINVRAFTASGDTTTERSAKFTVPAPPKDSLLVSIQNTTCATSIDGKVTLSVSGEGEYQYSLDNITYVDDSVFTDLAPGEYTAYAQSADTTLTSNFIISSPDPIILSSRDVVSPTCAQPKSGSFTVIAAGGVSDNYTFRIDGVATQTDGIFTGLAAGDYLVIVEDENGCSTTTEVVIDPPAEAPETPIITIQQNADPEQLATEVMLTVTNVSGTFTWFLDGEPIAGETTNQITLTSGGVYTVQVTNADGCPSAESEGFLVNSLVDKWEDELLVFPNPVQDVLQITLPSPVPQRTDVAVYNLQGQVITKQEFSRQTDIRINTQNLSAGTYLLRITSPDTVIQRKIQKY